MRLALFCSHPIPYFTPLYRLLAWYESCQNLKQSDFQFRVVYERGPGSYYDEHFKRHVEWDTDTATGYEWEIVSTVHLSDFFHRYRPDVCWLHGYANPRQLYTFYLAKLHHAKVWLRGESSLRSQRCRHTLRRHVLPSFFRQVDAFLAIGTANRLFYQAYHVPSEKIFDVPYACDLEFWMDGKPCTRPRWKPVILFVGKFQKQKRPLDVSLATADFAEVKHIGAGPLMREIEHSKTIGVTEFLNQKELRSLYYDADVLVVPSEYEPWGMVINEAMACGLPVVASDQVRAANDLVIPHITGMTYPCGDIPALRKAIKYVLDHRYTLGQNARNHVQAFSYQADFEGIRKAMALP